MTTTTSKPPSAWVFRSSNKTRTIDIDSAMAHHRPVVSVTTQDHHRFELIDCGDPSCDHTLLFLPGLGITARYLIGFGEALAQHGIRLLIHEWRGNGSSNLRAARGQNWGYQALIAQDIHAALQASSRLAGGPVAIGGHSLGAQLASIAAALHPARVNRLLIIAGGTPYWRALGGSMRIKILMAAGLFSSLSTIVGYLPGKRIGFGGREARSVMTDWSRTILTGQYLEPSQHEDGRPATVEAALAELALPVLTLRMQDDHWVPQSSLDYLLGKMPQATVEQRMIDAAAMQQPADHFGWMNAPAQPADQIGQWYQRSRDKIQA
ncbi:MAG: alpha/beta fold hydrolase [Pseudomonadota bacterium]